MNIEVPAASADLTSNGGTDGYVQVADNVPFYVGCEAFLSSDTQDGQRCVITDLVSTDFVGLRFIEEENCGLKLQPPKYGRSDCSAYTTADNAKLSMSRQLAAVDPASDPALV